METANTQWNRQVRFNFILANFELQVALITPSVIPGVFDQPVFQASDLVSAVTDNEYGMVNLS